MKILFLWMSLLLFPLLAEATVECSYDTASTVSTQFAKPLNDISRFNIMAAAKDCLLNILNSAWDSATGLAKSVVNCVFHPIDCAKAGIKAVKNAYRFISNLSSELNKLWTNLKAMNGKQITELICGIVGDIAGDVLLGILTAGAASGKLGLTISRVVLKIQKIGKILSHVASLPMKMLRGLGDDMLESLEHILKRGDKDQFMRRMKGGACAL